MDSFEAVKTVHGRILLLEPENVARKIIGYIYLQDLPDQEMIRLALGPDSLIHTLIQKAKTALRLAPVVSPPISPSINPNPISDPSLHMTLPLPASPRSFPSLSSLRRVDPYLHPQVVAEQQRVHSSPFKVLSYSDSNPEEYCFQNQFRGLEDQLDLASSGPSGFLSDYYCSEAAAFHNPSNRYLRNSPILVDYPVKACHYFNKGFCKHGSNCRYFHGEYFPESYQHIFGPNSYQFDNEDQVFPPGSLEKLELEIAELLKSRRGHPVSIASLPMIYYEKFGKTLQAEGYLTESQRHGKAGYSLTKLLARLKNSIRLIDRSHGQHAIILAEDAPKYFDIQGERNDPGLTVSCSRQIYLTFPAESTFTEEDVSNYFNTFGPVQDVRIPCQQKRMFGFVTFVDADTVKLILSKGNPHYVCGARVLVKPYREKSKLVDRKYEVKLEHPMYYHSQPIDIDSELLERWESSRLLRRQLMEEREWALEREALHLSQLQVAQKPLINQPCSGYLVDVPKMPEDNSKFSSERFNYLFDVVNSGSTGDDNPKPSIANYSDQESNRGLHLPDSPFASAVASSISAVI
ncbi:zinc finger CCCH domain-containing 18-like [Olea europaea subsp. europaea]|uniref:Zinc finger CCCH domain-containing 18-like n=1 Tax=Olea europaea subsp. europaea TaxID=158383 RepID=A0A8S0PPW8_OLEEU|nr:zinc finger CCCH domain-containing 18-like [Olea europaea subsp. europaea]